MAAFPRGISIAVFLPGAILDEVLEAPTLTYAASYGMANDLLNQVALPAQRRFWNGRATGLFRFPLLKSSAR